MLNTAIYFFPQSNQSLIPETTIDAFKGRIGFEPNYSILTPSEDANGHLVVDHSGESLYINNKSLLEGFRELLVMGKDIRIYGDSMIEIEFAIHDPKPHLLVQWSRKWFYFLTNEEKEKYICLLRDVASLSNSSFVIFIEDLFDMYDDRFEDRILYNTNKDLFLDDSPKKRSKWDFKIDEIWLKEDCSLVVQSERVLTPITKIGEGFTSYQFL